MRASSSPGPRLIETWDVLKSAEEAAEAAEGVINRNMGCIEITGKRQRKRKRSWINRNMGCIEIRFQRVPAAAVREINRNMGCIEIGKDLLFFVLPLD